MFGIRSSNQDQALLAQTEKMLVPFVHAGIDAGLIARKIFDEAKAEGQGRFGKDIYGNTFGDRAVTNGEFMAPRLAAGLTVEDVQDYWNRPLLLGLIEFKVREFMDFIATDVAQQQGESLLGAVRERRMSGPSYGLPSKWDPNLPANKGLTAEDADLYPEFAVRVGRWQERIPPEDQEVLVANYSSFNALVRSLIRQGAL
jgi:hypothetical protein